MPDNFERLKGASVRLVGGGSTGTGYLVAPQRIATCEHVIKNWGEDRHQAFIGPEQTEREAYVLKHDPEADCAILAFDEPIDVEPLPLANSLERKAYWEGYGYPSLAKGAGLDIDGVVRDPNTKDDRNRPSVLLSSEMVAAGTASPLRGFSGSPVTVDGAVVGHFKKHLGDPDDRGRAAYGVVYACPVDAVRQLLDVEHSSVEIAPPEVISFDESVPALTDAEYHVYVSYQSIDQNFASGLVSRLEGAGLRVCIDQKMLKAGDNWAQTPQSAMSRSRAAVVLVSHAWLEAPWFQQEANVLLKRAAQDPNFRLIPILIGHSEVPAKLAALRCLNFNDVSFEEDTHHAPVMDELIWGLIGQDRPTDENSIRIANVEADAVQEFVSRMRAAAKTSSERVVKVWKEWKLTGLKDPTPVLLAAKTLIAQANPELALEVLDEISSDGLRARQLRGLALNKSDRQDDAIEVLDRLRDEGQLDAETGGILAGVYRKRWLKSNKKNTEALETAYDLYQETFDLTGDTYPGINAAAFAYHIGEDEHGRELAVRVRELVEKIPETERDHWQWATLGEACLLSGQDDDARKAYRKAVRKAPGLHRDIASMRGGARLDLEALGRDSGELDRIFSVPRVVAFTGHMTDSPDRESPRFPEDKVGAVRREIAARLNDIGPAHGFSSAARGSDMIFIEELQKLGGRANVILPMPEKDFLEVSVGGQWNDRFTDIAKKVDLNILRDTRPPDGELPKAFDDANLAVQKRAIAFARELDEKPLLIAVWDGSDGDGRGGTSDAVKRWRAEGYEVDVIDVTRLGG
jgi:tetratricopeptide (TPR) repeat protein